MALLLLLTCVDMLSPGTCAEDLLGLTSATTVAPEHDRRASDELGTGQPRSEHGSESEHADEDCFCCCTHLLVPSHFALDQQQPGAGPDLAKRFSLPLSPPHALYHPPRSL